MLKELHAIGNYFGIWGTAAKIWEKCVVDRKRFRAKGKEDVPQFPESPPAQLPNNGQGIRPLFIYYLVHYFYPDRQGGTERFVLNMARTQQARGHRVKVFTLGTAPLCEYSSSIGEIFYRIFSFEGIEVVEFRYRKTPYGLFYKRLEPNDQPMQAFAAHFLESDRPDVVHCAYPQPMAAFLCACKAREIPYVVTLTDFNILCHYATMVDRQGHFCSGCDRGQKCARLCTTSAAGDFSQRYAAATRLLQGAAAVTVPSKFVASVVHQEFPQIAPYVIPHGIAPEFTHPRTPVRQIKTFAYIGTFSELKGIHLLIAAFQRLEGEATLDLYGVGSVAYERQMKRLALKDRRIRFHGAVSFDRMPEIYRTHDCIVVPSLWYETYNFVVREALASGCFVVASRIGAMPEAIDEGKNGFLFPAGDEQALLQALCRAEAFSEAVLPQEQPSIAGEAAQYEDIFMDCISGAARPDLEKADDQT